MASIIPPGRNKILAEVWDRLYPPTKAVQAAPEAPAKRAAAAKKALAKAEKKAAPKAAKRKPAAKKAKARA